MELMRSHPTYYKLKHGILILVSPGFVRPGSQVSFTKFTTGPRALAFCKKIGQIPQGGDT